MAQNNATNYRLTQYNVLTGGASGALNNIAPSSTSGVPLISQGSSSQPTFGTAVVAGGGTGATSFTAYSVITGGTTSTGSFQNVSGVGSSGNVLTSNDSGTLPTWQTVTKTRFPLYVTKATSSSLAASTTYWLTPVTNLTSQDARTRFYIPVNGTITGVKGITQVNVGSSSSATATLSARVNDTTDNTLASVSFFGNPNNFNDYTLNISLTAGDYIEFKLVTPAWASGPTQVIYSLALIIQ